MANIQSENSLCEDSSKLRFCSYIRVSTDNQTIEYQKNMIETYLQDHPEIELIESYIDDVDTFKERQYYTKMLNTIAMNAFNGIIIIKLDRIGFSISQLFQALEIFKKHHTTFISILDELDTSTPGGKLFSEVTKRLAEYEENLIQERTKIGMKNAQKHGTKSGKPIGHPKKQISDEEIKHYYIDSKMGCFKIAKLVGLSQAAVYHRLKNMNIVFREKYQTCLD